MIDFKWFGFLIKLNFVRSESLGSEEENGCTQMDVIAQ